MIKQDYDENGRIIIVEDGKVISTIETMGNHIENRSAEEVKEENLDERQIHKQQK